MKIYALDDDQEDLEILETAIREVGINVTFLSFTSFDKLLSEPPPDVIFMDINMPRKNGLECLKQLYEDKKFTDVSVVIFTTGVNSDNIKEAFNNGARFYVCKPYDFNAFVKTLKRLFELLKSRERVSFEQFVLN